MYIPHWRSLKFIISCILITAPLVLCGLPQSPLNGSLGSHLPTSPLGTTVTFQCDDGLFPNDTGNTTCTDMSGMGEWVPDPAELVCRKRPGEMPIMFECVDVLWFIEKLVASTQYSICQNDDVCHI